MGNVCHFSEASKCDGRNKIFDFGRDAFYGTTGNDTIYAADWIVTSTGQQYGPYGDSVDYGGGIYTVYIDRLSFPPLCGRDDFIQNCEHVIVENPPSATQPAMSPLTTGMEQHGTALISSKP